MLVRGAFNLLVRPGLRKDFRDAYNQFPEEYSMFLKTGSQDEAEVRATAISALGRMVKRSEVGTITYVDPKEAPLARYYDTEWALGFMISRQMIEDDLYGKANQNAKWLGRASRLTQEFLAGAWMDDAFNGSVYTGMFGEPLISATHALLNGNGTWSNLIAGNPQLSVTGLQAGLEMGESQVDHEGFPMPATFTKLFIDRTDEMDAIKLTQGEWEPYTTDRNVNAMKRKVKSLEYYLLHYKTVNGKWFLQDPQLIDSHFLFRIRPQFGDAQDEGGTLAAKFWGRQRINVFHYDARGWVGSNC